MQFKRFHRWFTSRSVPLNQWSVDPVLSMKENFPLWIFFKYFGRYRKSLEDWRRIRLSRTTKEVKWKTYLGLFQICEGDQSDLTSWPNCWSWDETNLQMTQSFQWAINFVFAMFIIVSCFSCSINYAFFAYGQFMTLYLGCFHDDHVTGRQIRLELAPWICCHTVSSQMLFTCRENTIVRDC